MVEVQYGLRLDGEEKKAFEELCRRSSISMAQAIKDFIHRANQAGELEITDSPIAASPDALAEIRDRLLALERIAPTTPDDLAELSDRLEEQGKGLSSVKAQILRIDKSLEFYSQFNADISGIYKNQNELGSRLNRLETAIAALPSDLLDRLSALEKCREADLLGRMESLEKTILGPTLPKKEIPQGLTHKELAAAIGSSERTMQRVSKEKERWPEGYHWSEESKKWFSMEG